MTDQSPPEKPPGSHPRLGEIGLTNYAPYLMNGIIDGPLIRELAVYSVVEQSTLSRALDQLATDGLVRRETDASDSRATRVYITEAGRTNFVTLWPRMAEAQERMFRGIPEDERRAFVGTLQKMLTNIRKHEI